jgi:dolichol-phosphate mannosyltransferase
MFLVVIACVAYLVLIRKPSGLSIRLVSAAVALETLVAVARPPAATQDLWYYAIYGRMVAVYHASPYTHVPADYPNNPFLQDVGRAWHHVPSVYGPVFTALSGVASFVLGSSYDGTRLFYQGLAAAALVTACVIVWRRTRSADAVAFLALNPVTALYLVNGGRNDILVGVALLGAVVLAARGRYTAAGLVGGLGALVKLTGMLGVVALVVALVVGKQRDGARRIGITAGLTVVAAYLVAGMSAVLTPMETAGALFSRLSVWQLLPQLGYDLPTTQLALALAGVVVCLVLLRSARSGPEVAVPATTTALTLGAAYTLPGYVGWALPTAALRHREPFARVAAYQAVLLVVAYEIVRHPLSGRLGDDLDQLVQIVGPLIVLALLIRLVIAVRARPRSEQPGPSSPARALLRHDEPIGSTLVVVPTLDERDNIERLLRGIRHAAPSVDVLVVDDDSPDGTADLAEALGRSLGSVSVLRRHGEPGLGAAYRDGFRLGLERGYDAIIEMDADLSHDPTTIPALVDALASGADLAIGARYVEGGGTPGWPLHRRLLSRLGGEYARVLLRLPSHDPTSGFRAFRADLLRECELDTVGAHGFAFQLEMLHRASRLGAHVVEVPIVFRDRTAGQSKLSGAIAQEALRLVAGLRRRPWQPVTKPALQA